MDIEKKVLLIDDDEDDLRMLQDALKDIDGEHGIIEAKNGIEGLELLDDLMGKKQLPCLIVLDINMPKMDGRETLVRIKSDQTLSKIPIVIFTTSSSQLDRTFFDKYDTAYFVKPINFQELKNTAARLINICYHRSSR